MKAKANATNKRKRGSISECVEFALSRDGKETIGKALYLALRILEQVPEHYVPPPEIDDLHYLAEIMYQGGFEKGKYDYEFIADLKIEIVPYDEFLEQKLKYKPKQ